MSNNKNKTPISTGMQNTIMLGSSPINVKHIPNHGMNEDFPSLKESQSIQKNNKNKPIQQNEMNEKEFVNMSSLPYSADTHSTPHKTDKPITKTQLNHTNNKNNQPNNNK